MTFPTNTAAHVDSPWTDPNGIQWIYNVMIPSWARYRVASTGGVSSFNDLTDVPAALTEPQIAATPSIRAIGTGATDAASGDHSHSSITIGASESVTFTGGVSGSTNIFADNVDGAWDVQMPNKSGTFAFLSDLGGTSNALVFGSGAEVVSMSLISSVATFTFGTNSKAALMTALGALPASSGTATDLTISGATTFSGGAAAQFRTALGAGTAGNAIFVSTAYSGVGSVRRLMGLDTTNSVLFNTVQAGATANIRSTSSGFDVVDPTNSNRQLFKADSAGANIGYALTVHNGYGSGSGVVIYHNGNIQSQGTNIISMSNGVNAQKLRVYGTTTGSKYAQLEHDGTNAKLSSSSGDLHISHIPTSNPGPGILWNDGGVLKIGT